MTRNRKLAVLVTVFLCMTMLFAVSASAAKLTDIEKHWGKEYIEYGVEKGYISGFEDNTFRPDEKVTRAQFAKMLNGAVKISGTSAIAFDDVATKDWFYTDIQKAQYAAYVLGYDNGDGSYTFKPNNPITRQEAAVILSRMVLPSAKKADLSSFKDGASIDTWAVNEVLMIAAKGYVSGDENKNFSPKGVLTRAAAAKIICEFVKNENIVNGEFEITKDTTVSETLFTDDVVVETADIAGIILKNCRVLGSVIVESSDVSVSLESSAVATVVNNGEDGVSVTADASSSVKTSKLNYPAQLRGNSFSKVVLGGKNLSSGTVAISGNVASVEVNGDATVKITGTADALTVTGKSNLVVQSGEVKTLTVEKKAAGSTINLAAKAEVEKAVNNAAVSYVGAGTIKEANNAVEGVSYETKPAKVTGKASEGDKAEADDDFFDDVTVSPTKGKTGVSPSIEIVFTFKKAVTDDDGKAINADYIEDYFKIKKSSASGSDVSYEAVVSGTKKVITLSPKSKLAAGTKYYVIIPKGTLTYSDGTTNKEYSTYFTVESDDKDSSTTTGGVEISITPANAKTASVDTSITISFSKAVYKSKSGSTLNADYCEDTAFEIRKGSKSGDEVPFTAEVNSSKKVVLKPNEMLEPGTKYYVVINNKLYDSEGSLIGSDYSYFTTDEGVAISVTPKNGATNVSAKPEIVIEFSEKMLQHNGDDLTDEYVVDEVVEIRKKSKTGDAESFTAKVATGSKKITITTDDELEVGQKYYIIINKETLVGSVSDEENEEVTSYFTVAKKTAPIVTPDDGKRNVDVATNVEITFAGELYAYSKTDTIAAKEKLTNANIAEYISEKKAITLRRKSNTGTEIKCNISLSDEGTVVLDPNSDLSLNYDYYVVVKSGMFYVGGLTSSDKNLAAESVFSTNEALKPEFSPEDEEKNFVATKNLTITFDEAISLPSGDEISAKYIKNHIVSFYERDTEEAVDYKASISGRVITIDPTESLKSGTYYVLKVNANSVINNSGVLNQSYSSVFRTELKIDKKATFDPTNKKTGVSIYVKPTITYATPIYKSNLDDITEEYLNEHNYVTLSYTESSKTKYVDARFSISSDFRVITISPLEPLANNTKYTVTIDTTKFAYEDDTSLSTSYKTFYFTTTNEEEEAPVECPICGGEHEEADCTNKPTEPEECTFCGEEHKDEDHVCTKCGKKGHETEKWCGVCETHAHNEADCEIANPECTFCGEAHKDEDHVCTKCGEKGHETEKWCDKCGEHTHNADEHCEKCDELDCAETTWCDDCEAHGHNTGDETCPKNTPAGGEGEGEGA